MNRPTPIACALHDLVEVACLYRIEVVLTLDNASVVRGRAVTTLTRPDKTEAIRMSTDHGEVEVPLHRLKEMAARRPNPHFDVVRFDTDATPDSEY